MEESDTMNFHRGQKVQTSNLWFLVSGRVKKGNSIVTEQHFINLVEYLKGERVNVEFLEDSTVEEVVDISDEWFEKAMMELYQMEKRLLSIVRINVGKLGKESIIDLPGEVVELPEDEREALNVIGENFERWSHQERAIHLRSFIKRFQNSPQIPEYLLTLSLEEEAVGNRSEAIRLLKFFLLSFPDHRLIANALEALTLISRQMGEASWIDYAVMKLFVEGGKS